MDFTIADDAAQKFAENGFAVIPGFLSPTEIERLKVSIKQIVENNCQDAPGSVLRVDEEEGRRSNLSLSPLHRDEHLLKSGDKIVGFFEDQAVDAEGKIVVPDVGRGLSRIGHALDRYDPFCNSVTFSSKTKTVLKKLTHMRIPTVIQSLAMFKHPKIGGVVTPHQDATFLYTNPVSGNLIGFWIALDEATVENGCLEFLPGSHKEGKLHQRFVRNTDLDQTQLFVFRGDKVPIPPKEKLVPAPAKPVLIDGLVIHQSEPNTSDKGRLAYTFHVIEGDAEYSTENWLQPTDAKTFIELK